MLSTIALIGALELGLVYALLAFGLYISFNILNIPDLTTDGSFVLGAVVSAVFASMDMPLLGIFIAILAGSLAGLVTATLQTKLGINAILSGILTMTGLYTINLLITSGKSNIALLNKTTLFNLNTTLEALALGKVIIMLGIVIAIYFIYVMFFKTQIGLCIRATGDNEDMVRASSIDTDAVKMIGFSLSNATVALSGALVAQMQQSADVNMGSGMVVIGLASLIIGGVIIKNKNIETGLISVVIGAIIYRLIIAYVLRTNIPASFLKLISSLIVMAALSVPAIKNKIQNKKLIKQEYKNAKN